MNSTYTSDWDAIVIGTGPGGATLGLVLAKAGWRVLFLEQGKSYLTNPSALLGNYAETFFPRAAVPGEEHRTLLANAGRWTQFLDDHSSGKKTRHIPFIGSGSGGSSALYGAAMERLFPADFRPAARFQSVTDTRLPESWPISYDDLEPYYRQAESLYRVSGGVDPLRPKENRDSLATPPAFCPANQELADFLGRKGLHPYRLPLACDLIPGCQTCQGYICQQQCKNDSVKVCLLPAITKYQAQLMDECRVIGVEATRKRVTGVVCERGGERLTFKARTVVLAAGALSTPLILLRSTNPDWPKGLANASGLVGRHLMRHCIDLYAVSAHPKPEPGDNTKELAFNDFYCQGDDNLGNVQSFGRLPPADMLVESLQEDLKQGPLPWVASPFNLIKPMVRRLLGKQLADALILATTLEDLPYPDNRVEPIGTDGAAITYRLTDAGRRRVKRFRAVMADVLSPKRYTLIKQAENNERLAHVCGTCRMGTDASDSVVDGFNRAHGLDNLYIVDASFFPSSGGTNPALTIAANALRVGDQLIAAGGR